MTGQVRTVDGRVAGRRGQATRQKLLDCLSEMLSSSPYRDVKVIDVARKAGTSPATFYQYFPDVEGAVLESPSKWRRRAPALTELVAEPLLGRQGRLADRGGTRRRLPRLLAQERRHPARGRPRRGRGRQAVLQDPDEDPELRQQLPHGVGQGAPGQGQGRQGRQSGGDRRFALVAMLAAVASHQKGFQTWGVKQAELKPNLATAGPSGSDRQEAHEMNRQPQASQETFLP